MNPISTGQFPHVRFRDGKRKLWNPVHRKLHEERPEERVRLCFLEGLIRRTTFPSSRIQFESGVAGKDNTTTRADILCYDKNLKPLLLVECKRPAVKLAEAAGIQLARYNEQIRSPYAAFTNGKTELLFRMEASVPEKLESWSDLFELQAEGQRDAAYWRNRGFLGGSGIHHHEKGLVELLKDWFSDPKNFSLIPAPALNGVELHHYYRVFEKSAKSWLLSLVGSHYGETWLTGISVEKESVTSIMMIPLPDSQTDAETPLYFFSNKLENRFNFAKLYGKSFQEVFGDPKKNFTPELMERLHSAASAQR